MNKFYIFGLQRSGTTFLENLVTQNFSATVANGPTTWKHSLQVPQDLDDHLVISVFKNPYTWLESIIFRDPADLLITATEYNLTVRSADAYIMGHDNVNLVQLCRLYNDYVTAWSATNFVKVNYECLLEDGPLDKFLGSLRFDRKSEGDWKIPEPGSLFMSEAFSRNNYGYYLNQKPLRFNESEMEIINKNIDFNVLSRIGYSPFPQTKSKDIMK